MGEDKLLPDTHQGSAVGPITQVITSMPWALVLEYQAHHDTDMVAIHYKDHRVNRVHHPTTRQDLPVQDKRPRDQRTETWLHPLRLP